MRLAVLPIAEVLNNIILLSGLVDQFPLTLEDACLEIALVARSVRKGINPMAVLFIILPISRVGVSVRIAIHTITVFLLASYTAFIAVAVAEILNRYHFCLHLIL